MPLSTVGSVIQFMCTKFCMNFFGVPEEKRKLIWTLHFTVILIVHGSTVRERLV